MPPPLYYLFPPAALMVRLKPFLSLPLLRSVKEV